MNYVLNLTTKQLSPAPTLDGKELEEFIPENAMLVSPEVAKRVSEAATKEEKDAIVTAILGNRMLNNATLTPAAKKILKAGMEALQLKDALPEAAKEEEPVDVDTTINLELETKGVAALLTKRQVSKLNHPNLLKYAREMLGLEVADNEPYEQIKAKVYAKQFNE